MVHAKHDLGALLLEKGGFQIVREDASKNQLRLFGRVPSGQYSPWPLLVRRLLEGSSRPGAGWSCDISLQYVLDQEGVKKGGRIIFQSDDLAAALDNIVAVVVGTGLPPRVELDSILLPGYAEGAVRSGQGRNGKGAAPVKAGTGAQAVALAQRARG